MFIDCDSELEFSLIDNAFFTTIWRRQTVHTCMDIWLKISLAKENLLDDVVVECLKTADSSLGKYLGEQKYIQIALSYLKEQKGYTSHLTQILEAQQSLQHT